MARKNILRFLLVLFVLSIPMAASARWKPPTEWTYLGSYSKVYNVANKLPKTLPLKQLKASKKYKYIDFRSDWGTMDIAKDIKLIFLTSGKNQVTVKVENAPPLQAYKILREIGDKLKQPLPDAPRKFR